MSKNGTTSAGTTRYRCTRCGTSRATVQDHAARDLRHGLDWLLGRASQGEHRLPPRTLRRHCQAMWDLIPPVPRDGVVHRVLHLDGIHLGHDTVVPVAMNEHSRTVGWHVARREASEEWKRLLARLAPPDLVVCDGDGGLLKALREYWPGTDVQRCLFHVCLAITKLTGRNPRTEPSGQMRELAVQVSRVHDERSAAQWLADWHEWCTRWQGLLDETTTDATGRKRPAHAPLVAVRKMVGKLVASHTMFTFLDHEDAPATNNRIESANGRIRQMLRDHRGLSKQRRIKAICWWCHQHGEHPEPDAWLVAHALSEQAVADWYHDAWQHHPQDLRDPDSLPLRYGIGIDWNAFHEH